MTQGPGFEALLAQLEAESGRVERLAGVLTEEHEALSQRDLATIERTARDKQLLVTELEQLERERRRWLAAQGLPTTRDGFGSLIAAQDREGRLTALWSTLRERLEQCREQNLENGRLLEPARRATQQALSILLGRDGSTELYDQQGTTHQQTGGRASFKV